MADTRYDRVDPIQHGIDNNPEHDTEKGAVAGGLGGAAVGAVAGSMMGPAGTAAGAAIGAVAGAVASGAAVNAVDRIDNDDTVSGIGDDVSHRSGLRTGGTDIDGTPDTRGVSEKVADAVTGDRIDDKTGKVVR
ncbi:MAG TPA: hypothetical protein VKT77_19880 [Chthonomonadaceae bacterium]|nr:hypothetical protein [Chthonomonadaceae bacterium]